MNPVPPPPPPPARPSKSRVIEGSLRCFSLGLAGLIPGLGFPCAILALRQHRAVNRIQAGHWNAAESYLTWGVVCGRIGLFVSLLLLGGLGLVLC